MPDIEPPEYDIVARLRLKDDPEAHIAADEIERLARAIRTHAFQKFYADEFELQAGPERTPEERLAWFDENRPKLMKICRDWQDQHAELSRLRAENASLRSELQRTGRLFTATEHQRLFARAQNVVSWKEAIETVSPELGGAIRAIYALEAALVAPTEGERIAAEAAAADTIETVDLDVLAQLTHVTAERDVARVRLSLIAEKAVPSHPPEGTRFLDHWEGVLAEIKRLAALSGENAWPWRPIETAPKDGSRVWVFAPDWTHEMGAARFLDEFSRWVDDDEEPLMGNCPVRHAICAEPTHWMPLPPAPEGAS